MPSLPDRRLAITECSCYGIADTSGSPKLAFSLFFSRYQSTCDLNVLNDKSRPCLQVYKWTILNSCELSVTHVYDYDSKEMCTTNEKKLEIIAKNCVLFIKVGTRWD